MVASFWQVAASRTPELVERISDEHATYVIRGGPRALARWDYWQRWKARPGATRASKDLDLATKCLFLNRTTFSGILHGGAGPIGGRAQISKYGIGCRFNLPALIERLDYIGHLYKVGRIVDVWQADWKATLQNVAKIYKRLLPNRVVAYLDPPYLSKSGKLYRRSIDVQGTGPGIDLDWVTGTHHYMLSAFLRREMQFRWILSYDCDKRLLADDALYASKSTASRQAPRRFYTTKSWRISKRVVTSSYTASSRSGRGQAKEFILTTFPPATVPMNERLMVADQQGAGLDS